MIFENRRVCGDFQHEADSVKDCKGDSDLISNRQRRRSAKNQNRPGVRAALTRIEGGNDKEESLLINRSAGGVTRFPFDGFSINRKCVKNSLSM